MLLVSSLSPRFIKRFHNEVTKIPTKTKKLEVNRQRNEHLMNISFRPDLNLMCSEASVFASKSERRPHLQTDDNDNDDDRPTDQPNHQ